MVRIKQITSVGHMLMNRKVYNNVILRNKVKMEIIGKISRGSKMDQIYIPKNRAGFNNGEYVLISPLKGRIEKQFKPHFYNLNNLEPIKMKVIEDIFSLINRKTDAENVIITGSFLEKGFGFNDIDILLINEKKINVNMIREEIEKMTGIKTHIILLNNKTLILGLSSDPFYNLMLSKCVSKNKFIFKIKRKINYKLLDLNLLKSKILIDNFEILSGNEKYYLTLNMISILLFIQGKKLDKETINKDIERIFNMKIKELKNNLINKRNFLRIYKEIFSKTFNLILDNIKRENDE